MKTYVINDNYSSSRREIKAAYFATVGDFIDFYGWDSQGDREVLLRVRADAVNTVERVD